MERVEYYNLPQLNNLYLEDSFVLDIKAEDNYIEFLLEVVLAEDHPLYCSPSPKEQYCYKKAKICFSNAQKIIWIEKTNLSYVDANNEIDFGNIDQFYQCKNHFYLCGDWGKVKIIESLLSVIFLD